MLSSGNLWTNFPHEMHAESLTGQLWSLKQSISAPKSSSICDLNGSGSTIATLVQISEIQCQAASLTA
jgi:hypothetical protein